MTCLGPAPTTPEAWFAIVSACATAAGGPEWASLAFTGLATVALVGLLVLAVGAWAVGR